MGFFKSLFGGGNAPASQAPEPPKPSSRSSARYTDLGAPAGSCTTCGRETYPIPGPILMKLTFSDQVDKVESNAMWCLSCDTLFCMGCAHTSGQKCSKCSGQLGDVHHRKAR